MGGRECPRRRTHTHNNTAYLEQLLIPDDAMKDFRDEITVSFVANIIFIKLLCTMLIRRDNCILRHGQGKDTTDDGKML